MQEQQSHQKINQLQDKNFDELLSLDGTASIHNQWLGIEMFKIRKVERPEKMKEIFPARDKGSY